MRAGRWLERPLTSSIPERASCSGSRTSNPGRARWPPWSRGLRHGYLDHGPWAQQADGSYTGPAATGANTFINWNHHIGSVVNALAAAGLRIEFLHEYDFTDAPFHGLERGGDGLWRIPAGRFRIPLMFSLRAAKVPLPS